RVGDRELRKDRLLAEVFQAELLLTAELPPQFDLPRLQRHAVGLVQARQLDAWLLPACAGRPAACRHRSDLLKGRPRGAHYTPPAGGAAGNARPAPGGSRADRGAGGGSAASASRRSTWRPTRWSQVSALRRSAASTQRTACSSCRRASFSCPRRACTRLSTSQANPRSSFFSSRSTDRFSPLAASSSSPARNRASPRVAR